MYVEVQVTPGGRKERVTKTRENAYTIVVREPAKRNMANKRVQAILATAFGVSEGKVRLVAGHRGHKKIFDIELETT